MKLTTIILLFSFSLILGASPPLPPKRDQVYLIPSVVEIEKSEPKNLKRLEEEKIKVVNAKVTTFFFESGKIQEHEFIITAYLTGNKYFPNYEVFHTFSDAKNIEIISHTCEKLNFSSTTHLQCDPSSSVTGNRITFSHDFKLYNGEYISIKYRYKITQKEGRALFKQEYLSIYSANYKGADCYYKFIIPK